jgi:hypothetical protein
MLNEVLNTQKVLFANDISNLIKPKSTKPAAATVSSSSSAPSASTTAPTSTSGSAPVLADDANGDAGLKRKAEETADEAVKEDESDKKVKI